jgi:hypothetical protein
MIEYVDGAGLMKTVTQCLEHMTGIAVVDVPHKDRACLAIGGVVIWLVARMKK